MPTPKTGYRDAQGNKLPGVTTILGAHKDAGGMIWSAWDLGRQGREYQKEWKRAADIGTCVHARIQSYIEQSPFPANDHDEAIFNHSTKPYESFTEWAKGKTFPGKCELGLVHPGFLYGGTLDYYDQERNFIYDWKSSRGLYPEVWAQIGGYAMLIKRHFGLLPDAQVVRFDKEGGPVEVLDIKADSAKAQAGRDLFFGLLAAYQAKRIIEGSEAR